RPLRRPRAGPADHGRRLGLGDVRALPAARAPLHDGARARRVGVPGRLAARPRHPRVRRRTREPAAPHPRASVAGAPRPRAAAPRAAPASPAGVVTLGRQDLDAKQPQLLLEAMASVLRTRRAHLALVGEIRPELQAQLTREADELGIADAFEITGYVDDAEYRRRLDAASCAVQLRRTSGNGEGSAAVNDALAAGLPVITNLVSCRELPAGTVQLTRPQAAPGELADEILRVLDDEQHRLRLQESALAYSRSWTFDHVTATLLEIVDSSRTERWQPKTKTA